ncbi:MAG: hypothetical protein VW518_07040, partial [Burkholderiaceae bacterium]
MMFKLGRTRHIWRPLRSVIRLDTSLARGRPLILNSSTMKSTPPPKLLFVPGLMCDHDTFDP